MGDRDEGEGDLRQAPASAASGCEKVAHPSRFEPIPDLNISITHVLSRCSVHVRMSVCLYGHRPGGESEMPSIGRR